MAVFSAPLLARTRGQSDSYGLASRPQDAYQLATIEWGPGQILGFVNRGEAKSFVPESLVINDARIAPDGFKRPKREGNIESGIVPIQKATIKFQDKGRSLSRIIAEKRINGFGIGGKILRLYEWEAGTELDMERDQVGTYRLDDRGWLDGHRKLTGQDVRRQLKTKIFEPEGYKLVTGLFADGSDDADEGRNLLIIKVPYDLNERWLPTFKHDDRYSSDPGEDVIYLKIESGEILKCYADSITISPRGKNYARIGRFKRGALNTEHLIDGVDAPRDDVEEDNYPQANEWIYLEETLPNLVSLITTGRTINDDRLAPKHWHAGMDYQWFDPDSFTYAAPELSALPLRAENYGSISVKELIEKEILPFIPATMQVSAQGKLQLRRITTIDRVGADRIRFDQNDIDLESVGEIKTIVSHIRSGIAVRSGWDARSEEFASPIYFSDAAQRAANDPDLDAKPLILDSKLLHSSLHTNAQIRRLLPALAEHYLGEKLVFSFKTRVTSAVADVGQRVTIFLPDHPDDSISDGVPDIGRSFLVTSVDVQDNGTVYQVVGTNGLARTYGEALNGPALDDALYSAGATPLRNDLPAGAIQEIGGVYYLQPGIYPLSFRKKYVFEDGPLYQLAGANIICASGQEGPMFQLWVPHAWHSDSQATVTTTGKGGKPGGAPGSAGHNGYSVATIGTGSVTYNANHRPSNVGPVITSADITSRPGVQAQSFSTGGMPPIALSYNNNSLVGLPADLSGYSGCGGGSIRITALQSNGTSATSLTPGGTGAANTAGVMIICRGATMGPQARFIVNGQDGGAPVTVPLPTSFPAVTEGTIKTSAGSGSGPGTVILGIDGPFDSPELVNHVEAYAGETFYHGAVMRSSSMQRATRLDVHSLYKALPHTVNYAQVCSRVVQMPASANIQERDVPLSAIARFFATQPDSRVRLIIGSLINPPSDGNPGDMLITQIDLDSNLPKPYIKVFRAATGWTDFDWERDEFAYVYAGLIANNRRYDTLEIIASATRPVGKPDGTVWYNTETGAEWVLYASPKVDVLLRVNDVPVGENLIKPGGKFIFTRNADLRPFDTRQPSSASFGTDSIFNLRYEAPYLKWDAGSLTRFDIKKGIVASQRYITSVNSRPYQYDLSQETDGSFFITGMPDGINSAPINVSIVAVASGGIILTDRGRSVSGTARPENAAQPYINDGQQIKLTLGVETEYPVDINGTVGANGAFSIQVSSTFDSYLGKVAQLYATNGASDDVTLRFTYEV